MTAYPLTKAAFPDFDLATMPDAMPQGFIESSWKNDTCPSFINEALHLQIFVDYTDLSLREFDNGSRFVLLDTVTTETVFETDDWQAMLTTIAAIQEGVRVTNVATATAFLVGLHRRGLAYHPDDKASDCLSSHNLEPADLQAIQINMRQCFEYLDPSAILLSLINSTKD